MNRREMLAAAGLAGLAPLADRAAANDTPKETAKALYELRLYQMPSMAKTKALLSFLASAAVPAWNRLGLKPVGVFGMMDEAKPDVYVLLPHASMQSVLTATHRMMADAEFLKAAGSFLDAPKKDPAFDRIESSLLLAFDEMPKLARPTDKDTRIFQLRIYESHSLKKAQKKIEMFNAGGEMAIFRRAGLRAVFFGEALVGTKLPHLTYMLAHDDEAAMKAGWKAFLADPGWKKLRADPRYKDTVSNITNLLLRPAGCSQI